MIITILLWLHVGHLQRFKIDDFEITFALHNKLISKDVNTKLDSALADNGIIPVAVGK